jgi:hypothetical protein
MGLLLLALLEIQGAEATVAVGLERAHAEFVGQGEGLLVVGFGLRDIGGVGVGMEDAKLVQCNPGSRGSGRVREFFDEARLKPMSSR